MNYDVCRNCQIQAPHRDGRTACPRCSGPLVVVADGSGAGGSANTVRSGRVQPGPVRRSVQAPPAPMPRSVAPAAPQPPRPAPAPPRPAPARPTLRWVAHRPHHTLPPRRSAPKAARPTPSYGATPRWGLVDVPSTVDEVVSPFDAEQTRLLGTLRITGMVLTGAAVTELIRYLVIVVNRSRPIPAWLDQLTGIAVLVFGVMAVVATAVALWRFSAWIVAFRADAYRNAGRLDPRRPWSVRTGVLVPFVNVVTFPWLALEAADVDSAPSDDPHRLAPDVRRLRIVHLSVAWALVNVVALIALGYRIAGFYSTSVQTAADGLVWTTLTVAAGAAFAFWTIQRLPRIVEPPAGAAQSPRRLVAL
ncbi:MAG: DUF4328 domain-containing protein [Gordonia sp. (in: high G+C Gram-positive bacteria)]